MINGELLNGLASSGGKMFFHELGEVEQFYYRAWQQYGDTVMGPLKPGYEWLATKNLAFSHQPEGVLLKVEMEGEDLYCLGENEADVIMKAAKSYVDGEVE
jgi:hypothetical protein